MIHQFDPRTLKLAQDFCPNPGAFTKATLGDELILVHHDSLPPGELPLYCVPDYHALAVIDLNSAAIFEKWLDGRYYPPQVKGYGSSTLVPAGISHQVRWNQSIGLTTLYLHTTLLDRLAEQQINGNSPTLIPKFKTEDKSLYHLAMALKAELLRDPHQSGETLDGQYLVMALAWRLINHHAVGWHQRPLRADRLGEADLSQVLEYINTYLETDIQIGHLASLVDLDELEFWQRFSASMGMDPYHYVRGQRLQRAQQLLAMVGGHHQPSLSPQTLPSATAASALEMTLDQLNSLVLDYRGESLTDTQVRILLGVLKGQRYGELAQQYQLSQGHIKTIAAELWKVLSQVLGQPIRRANLRFALQQRGLLSS